MNNPISNQGQPGEDQPGGRWSQSERLNLPSSPIEDDHTPNPGTSQPDLSVVKGLPWDYVIWGVGIFLNLIFIFVVGYDEPDNLLEQQAIAAMETRDLISNTALLMTLTALVWVVYRGVRSFLANKADQ